MKYLLLSPRLNLFDVICLAAVSLASTSMLPTFWDQLPVLVALGFISAALQRKFLGV